MASRMADTLAHRGPDDKGVWVDAASGVALGHRRLAVIDLSPTGRQPMVSGSGRFIIVYNGELYNFRELRRELEQCGDGRSVFRGPADTEVILACFDRWGVEGATNRFNGMFAFAVWDQQEHVLHLGRDRLGEKPLYYGWLDGTFFFGSELKALRAHPEFHGEINHAALMLYMRHNCVPAPHSIYRGISKLSPGNIVTVSRDSATQVKPVPYWELKDAVKRGKAKPFAGTPEDAVNQLDTLFRDAIRIRMLADVPLGGFLSGGVDSSIVTALMQAQSSKPVKTFTIGLHERAYDESQSAAAVARHLGTDHTELNVSAAEALSVIPKLPTMFDEPFADSSQIPTFLVSHIARQFVTVGLSGDGGDELFGGYNRHVWSNRIWDSVRWLPGLVRNTLAEAICTVAPEAWDRILDVCDPLLPDKLRHRNPGFKLHKLAGLLASRDRESLYIRHSSHWLDPAEVLVVGSEPASIGIRGLQDLLPDFVEQMMFLDTVTYLPDDILAKVDRASMAVSLETRLPFLDDRIVEFAWSLPLSWKIRDGRGKWLLRELLYRYVPQELVDRPKMGFGVPLGSWLRGPLRDWSEALLDEDRLRIEGFFKPAPIRRIWSEHMAGRGLWQYHLWDVLMFQSWLEASKQPFDARCATVALEPISARCIIQ